MWLNRYLIKAVDTNSSGLALFGFPNNLELTLTYRK